MSESDVIGAVEGDPQMFLFWCPGCKTAHCVDKRWTFNGDMTKPTVRASVLVGKDGHAPRCHMFITDGQIRYLADCDHALAGKTVEMEPWSALFSPGVGEP